MRIHNWSELQKCAKFEIIVFDQFFFVRTKKYYLKYILADRQSRKYFIGMTDMYKQFKYKPQWITVPNSNWTLWSDRVCAVHMCFKPPSFKQQ